MRAVEGSLGRPPKERLRADGPHFFAAKSLKSVDSLRRLDHRKAKLENEGIGVVIDGLSLVEKPLCHSQEC
jgi:hypothetical protein